MSGWKNNDFVERADRHSAIAFMVLAGIAGTILSLIEAVNSGFQFHVVGPLILSVVNIVGPFFLPRDKNNKLIWRIVAVLIFFTLTGLIFRTGALVSAPLILLLPFLLAVTFAFGMREAGFVAVLVLSIYAILFFNTDVNEAKAYFNSFSRIDWGITTIAWAFGAIYIFVSATIYRSEMNEAVKKFAEISQAAEAASHAKSDFLANMSHEIRTPMNGVLGMAQVLRQSKLSEQQIFYADIIQQSGEALLTIINDILDFSKIEAGKLELDEVPFDLLAAVEDVTSLLSVGAFAKNVEIIPRIRPGTPTNVVGDAGRIRQILTNLIGNAVKFTHEGSVIVDVTGRLVNDSISLTIEIQDTGIGIPEDKLELIFGEFSQADSSTTRKYGGTGLGLSITKSLVTAMNGEINVKSTVGEGTTFSIKLNLPNHGSDNLISQDNVSLKGTKILLFGEDRASRAVLEENIRAWGADLIVSGINDETFNAFLKSTIQKNDVNSIVLDCTLTDSTILNFLDKILERNLFPKTPAIVVLPTQHKECLNKIQNNKFLHVVEKPVKLASLKKKILEIKQKQIIDL